jgi:hypothetical protein
MRERFAITAGIIRCHLGEDLRPSMTYNAHLAYGAPVRARFKGKPSAYRQTGRFALAAGDPVAFASASRPPLRAAYRRGTMIIRAKNFRSCFKANLREHARDIANHGADADYGPAHRCNDCRYR